MTDQQKKFEIIKSLVREKISNNYSHLWESELDKTVKPLGETGRVLAELLKKEIKVHNSKIRAKITRVENLRYKDYRSFKSNLLKGHSIPYRTIDKLIKENPDKGYYDIFLKLQNK